MRWPHFAVSSPRRPHLVSRSCSYMYGMHRPRPAFWLCSHMHSMHRPRLALGCVRTCTAYTDHALPAGTKKKRSRGYAHAHVATVLTGFCHGVRAPFPATSTLAFFGPASLGGCPAHLGKYSNSPSFFSKVATVAANCCCDCALILLRASRAARVIAAAAAQSSPLFEPLLL